MYGSMVDMRVQKWKTNERMKKKEITKETKTTITIKLDNGEPQNRWSKSENLSLKNIRNELGPVEHSVHCYTYYISQYEFGFIYSIWIYLVYAIVIKWKRWRRRRNRFHLFILFISSFCVEQCSYVFSVSMYLWFGWSLISYDGCVQCICSK